MDAGCTAVQNFGFVKENDDVIIAEAQEIQGRLQEMDFTITLFHFLRYCIVVTTNIYPVNSASCT